MRVHCSNILVLAKLVRNSPVDLGGTKYLAWVGELDEGVLKQRYQMKPHPNLANVAKHDLAWRDPGREVRENSGLKSFEMFAPTG